MRHLLVTSEFSDFISKETLIDLSLVGGNYTLVK